MKHLTYKQLEPADYERFVAIEAQAFNEEPDLARLSPEMLPGLRGLYDGNELVAQLQLFAHQLSNGSGTVASGGIGSVAVAPEQRGRGYTESLLRHACAELHEAGTPVCMLFPFRVSFYHRFGWATAMERRVYTGSPRLLRQFAPSPEGRWQRVGDEAVAQLDAVYRHALRGRWGPLVRDEAHWQREVLRTWEKKQHAAYLWTDTAGRPRAYLIASQTQAPRSERQLRCREAVALDPLARSQIFSLLAAHETQCAEFVLPTPSDAPVGMLLTDQPRCAIEPYFMLRLVDVARALALFPYPKEATGRLAIAVTDDWLPHNAGTFLLEVHGGAGRCETVSGVAPDLRCDLRVLTQIATRYLRPRTAAAFGLLDAPSPPALALLDTLFAGLAPFFGDYF